MGAAEGRGEGGEDADGRLHDGHGFFFSLIKYMYCGPVYKRRELIVLRASSIKSANPMMGRESRATFWRRIN